MTTENESRSITPTIPAQATDAKADRVSLLIYQIVIETLRSGRTLHPSHLFRSSAAEASTKNPQKTENSTHTAGSVPNVLNILNRTQKITPYRASG
jgi:hypothetical protein